MRFNEQQTISIRSSWPIPEINRTPLELLIAKEEPVAEIRIDAELAIFLGDFAHRFPDKWPTIRERINDPRSSMEELARRLNINRSTVMRHLRDLRSEAKKWLNPAQVDYNVKSSEVTK